MTRTRDPDRKEHILAAAADLVARNGFTAVSMEDIGGAVGITASAIYRHYDSKLAMLVAMFDRVIDRLLSDGQRIAADMESGEHADPERALRLLIDGQIGFVTDDRDVAQVYYREIANLPEADRRRLRRKQRLYLEEWVHLLTELRPDLDDSAARSLVHASIGVIQSVLQYSPSLPDTRLRSLLRDAALAVLIQPSRGDTVRGELQP